MSSAVMTVALIVLVIAAVVLIALALLPRVRSRRLQNQFGPEYERTVQESDSRRVAERELAERRKRHEQLQLRTLNDDEKRRYNMQWAHVQEQFIDNPARSLDNADRLLTQVMSDRGYPTESYDQQVADLSVDHAAPLEQFRRAHEIAARTERGEASTEDMRAAIVNYRRLFVELVDGNGSEQPGPATQRQAQPGQQQVQPGQWQAQPAQQPEQSGRRLMKPGQEPVQQDQQQTESGRRHVTPSK